RQLLCRWRQTVSDASITGRSPLPHEPWREGNDSSWNPLTTYPTIERSVTRRGAHLRRICAWARCSGARSINPFGRGRWWLRRMRANGDVLSKAREASAAPAATLDALDALCAVQTGYSENLVPVPRHPPCC